MKNAFVFLLLTLCAAAGAQAPVPVSEEPRHRVVFENAYVKVIDALMPPGEVTLFHTHARDNVPVAISGTRAPLPFEWHEAGRAVPYRADAGAAREWVEIEWKD